jgi:phosphoribosylanthranilate isomerase
MDRARRAGPGWHVVLVKICGVTSEQDALVAVAMGADAVGFVFAPSPRQMTADAVGAITRRLPHETLAVGVFRDELPQRVVELAGRAGLRAVQLHGHESAEDVAYVKERVPLVIKALVAGEALGARAERYDVDAILLDASSPGK